MLSQFIKMKKNFKYLIILGLTLGLFAACATPPKETSDGTISAAERLARIKKTGTSKEIEANSTDAKSQTAEDSSGRVDSGQEKNTQSGVKNPELYDSLTSVYTLPKAKKRVHISPEVSKETKDAYKDALKSMQQGLTNKDFDGALQQFEALAAQDNQFSGPSANIAMIYLHQEKFAEAETAFKKALEINNENERAHNNLGLVYRELGKFSEAKASYQSAIELEPKYAEAHYNLGILAELYLHDIELAIQSFEHYKLAHRKKDDQVDTWLVDLRNRLKIEQQLAAQGTAQADPNAQGEPGAQTVSAASETSQETSQQSEQEQTTQQTTETEQAPTAEPSIDESQSDQNVKTDSDEQPSPVESENTSEIQESE